MTQRKDLQLHPGGLYRCCIESFNLWVFENPDAQVAEGEKITCRFERENPAQMIVSGRVAHWLDPDYPPIRPPAKEAQ